MILNWAVIFLVVAIIAALFGFGGIASESAYIARILFAVFAVLFLLVVLSNFLGYPIRMPF